MTTLNLEKLIELMNNPIIISNMLDEPLTFEQAFFATLNPHSNYAKRLANELRNYFEKREAVYLEENHFLDLLTEMQKTQQELNQQEALAKQAAKSELERRQWEEKNTSLEATPLQEAMEIGQAIKQIANEINVIKDALLAAQTETEVSYLWRYLQQQNAKQFVMNAQHQQIQFYNANGEIIPPTPSFLNRAAEAYTNPNAIEALKLVMKSSAQDNSSAQSSMTAEKASLVAGLNAAFHFAKACASPEGADNEFDYKALLAANRMNSKNAKQQAFLQTQQAGLKENTELLYNKLHEQLNPTPEHTYSSPFTIPKPGALPKLRRE